MCARHIPDFILRRRPAIVALCRRFGVVRLELFGSALGDDFRFDSSDLDFIVEFGDRDLGPWARDLTAFAEALEAMFERPVDLIQDKPLRNPYLREAIDATRTVIYESKDQEAPV